MRHAGAWRAASSPICDRAIGTIKVGVCARGVDVGGPRRPVQRVGPADRERLEHLVAAVARAEDKIEADLKARADAREREA